MFHRHALLLVAFAAGLLTAGCSLTETPGLAEQTTTPTTSSPSSPAEPEPVPSITPKPSDFTLSIRVMEKSCFGSAGCNITYRINPVYTGPPLADGQEITVTYEVRGGEDTKINSFELVGDEASVQAEEFIGTRSSSSKLRAVVTDVF